MATPHINAEMGDFADVVLMPGDPLRAKYIAETFTRRASGKQCSWYVRFYRYV